MGSEEVVPENVKIMVTNKRTADKQFLPYTPKVLLLMAIFERGEGDLEKFWKVNASRRNLSNGKRAQKTISLIIKMLD